MLEVLSQLVCQKAEVGAVGKAKHSVLMYWLGLPGLVSVPHPGPVRRFGKAQGSLLFSPWGSPSVPKVAVNGTPSLALKIPLNSQPFAIQSAGREANWRAGICQVALITRTRPTSYSDRPRIDFRSYQGKLESAFVNWSPPIDAEPVSMLLPHV